MKVNMNIAAGWATRGIVLLLALINTRLLIESVGAEGLAAYSIIISLTPWLALLNLGLPITIQNLISISRQRGDGYLAIRDHSFGTMLIQAFLLLPVTIIFACLTHWLLLVNYPFVSIGTVIGMHVFIYVTGVCQLFTQIMYAEHESFWPNIYPAFAPIWTTSALLTALYFDIEQFNLLMLVVAASNILMPLHAGWVLKVFSRARFNLETIRHQLASSKQQMLFAAMAAATLSIDYALMSRILSHLEIVEYNLTSRLFLTLLVLHGVVLATSWTPLADLMHSGKMMEARGLLEQLLKRGLIISIGAGFLIVISIDPLAQLLTGGAVKTIPIGLAVAFWFYILLRVLTDTFAMAIQSCGMVIEINKFLPLQALISVTCQYTLGLQFGSIGIVFGLIISFLLTASWIIPRKFYSMTRQ
jgi:hypothetical protein